MSCEPFWEARPRESNTLFTLQVLLKTKGTEYRSVVARSFGLGRERQEGEWGGTWGGVMELELDCVDGVCQNSNNFN